MTEGLVKTLLHNIFGILTVPCDLLCHGKRSLLVAHNQALESPRITALRGCDQRTVGIIARICIAKRFHDFDPPPPMRRKIGKAD